MPTTVAGATSPSKGQPKLAAMVTPKKRPASRARRAISAIKSSISAAGRPWLRRQKLSVVTAAQFN